MNDLQIFNNPQFGEIRTVEVDEKLKFVASDITKALGYLNSSKTIKDHCRWVAKCYIPHPQNPDKNIEVNVIEKGDVYRLIANSELPGAEKFESWIFDEVVPSVVDTGAYITNKANPEELRKKADEIESMTALNEAAKIILPVLEEAGLKPQYRAIALKQIYRKSGMELPIDEMKADRELFDLMSIANAIGVYSTKGKPHGQAIGAIIKCLTINEEEKELVTFEKNGHSGTAFQYTKSVIAKVKEWIEVNGYPDVITFVDSTGKSKKYSVTYEKQVS
ncbi:MAG: BRO family protein [Clostridia bacterium]|nr:BRO family protein [Clostridia bacterium]